MYVIGTAGHVDHGKSTLVQALTGIDPDRLKEEQERQMTIDLGFAWVKLDGYEDEIGIVDVPGHRDFIENMLAGVGGIDIALLVVAADEGVMPQTREHLAILDLLEVKGGVVALTKVDLVDDPEWLELVTLDLVDILQGTVLEYAPLVQVSAINGQGLSALREALSASLSNTESRSDFGLPRLPIDRVFSLSGFGTVLTGTLGGGRLNIGDAIEIYPKQHKGRIRGLQTHRTQVSEARPGSRVAVNVTGISKEQISRGDVLSFPDVMSTTILCDTVYRQLPEAKKPLKHNQEVKLFIGAAEIMARTRILGQRQIAPGQRGWVQLALSAPSSMLLGDHFILRQPSPPATLGGGRVLDAHPGRKHRRFKPEIISRLETFEKGTSSEIMLQSIIRSEPTDRTNAIRQSGLPIHEAEEAFDGLKSANQIVILNQYVLSTSGLRSQRDTVLVAVKDYHHHFPLRLGMPKEELRSRLNLPSTLFGLILQGLFSDGELVEGETQISLPGHNIQFSEEQKSKITNLLRQFDELGINSPSVKEAKEVVGDEVYFALLELDRLIQLSPDVVYEKEYFADVYRKILAYMELHNRINAAQLRDLLETSRKYAIAILEYLDEVKVTRRVGDDRELVTM
jgi:selenocysteine-specific elongation factor